MHTILIVDSQPARRNFLVIALEQAGHRVVEAQDGEQAKRLMRLCEPDLVLLDALVAPSGGYQFLRYRHDRGFLQRVPLILLAAPYLADEVRSLVLACGASHLVTDAADTSALIEAINEALAAPPQAPVVVLGDEAVDKPLYRMLARMNGRVAQLEVLNARLQRNFVRGNARLGVARSALDEAITERLQTYAELFRENFRLRQESVRDPLTGLYNRRYLEESLVREEARARRTGWPMSVMMIDIDHFKQFNDTYGHAAGDEVLRAVGRCMASQARSEDIICRYGGEEFVLVMSNTAPYTLWQRADALRTGVPRLHIEYDQRPIGPITLSIGLAIYPDNGDSAHAVLRAADTALYRAKHSGRDRIVPAINA